MSRVTSTPSHKVFSGSGVSGTVGFCSVTTVGGEGGFASTGVDGAEKRL